MVAVLAFGYTCLRAVRLSITHDEAITYLFHASRSFATIWTYGGSVPSNNHLLNTILVKLLVGVFGLSEWVVRMPALLGHLLYLVGMIRILRRYFRGGYLLGSGLLLFSHPFLLDLFSLSRGYALSLGFLGLGLNFFLKGIPSKQNEADGKSLVWALLLLALSAVSTFSFLSIYLGLVCVVVIFEISRGVLRLKEGHSFGTAFKSFLWRGLIPVAFISFLLFLVIVKPILTLVREKEFYFGGTAGFWQDTITSLISVSVYDVPWFGLDLNLLGKCLLVISFATYGFYLLFRLRVKRVSNGLDDALNAIVLLALFIVLIINLQNVLLGTKFLLERSAVFLIPLFLLFFLLLWRSLVARNQSLRKFFATTFFIVVTTLLCLHNLFCFNLTHTLTWRYDASTKEAMRTVLELSSPGRNPARVYTLGVNWLLAPSASFYILKDKMVWIRETKFRHGPEGKFDFSFFLNEDRDYVVSKYRLKVVKYFDQSKTCLAVPEFEVQ